MEKCRFGNSQIPFLGHTITETGLSPNEDRVQKSINNINMPKTIKQVHNLIGFIQYFEKFFPNLAVKLHPFLKLLPQKRRIHYQK